MGKLIGMLDLAPNPSSWPSWDHANRTFQHEYLTQVLKAANGNQCLAAHLLGIHRNTLSQLCRRVGVDAKSLRNKKKLVYRIDGVHHGTP